MLLKNPKGECPPLSRELCGVVLPHEHYGSHLNAAGETIDEELEVRNFQFAGESLAEIWSGLMIDGYETFSEYIIPQESQFPIQNLVAYDQQWFQGHVRTS